MQVSMAEEFGFFIPLLPLPILPFPGIAAMVIFSEAAGYPARARPTQHSLTGKLWIILVPM